jgi:hypothetical protein
MARSPQFSSFGRDRDFNGRFRRIDRRQFKHGNGTGLLAIVKAPGAATLGLCVVDQVKDFDDPLTNGDP